MDAYQVVRHLGKGAFGEVTEVKEKANGSRFAVKVIRDKRYETWEECLKLREVRSLMKLGSNNSNIVGLHKVIRENKRLYLVFDYHPSNLYRSIKNQKQNNKAFSIEKIARWSFELLDALSYMHRMGFFHRDIKPENLLLDENESIKVCDFGLAREVRSCPPYTEYVSTKWYRAPELVLRANKYNSPVDIWAAACVIAELLSLTPLFPAKDTMDHLLVITGTIGSIQAASWPYGNSLVLKSGLKLPKKNVSERPLRTFLQKCFLSYQGQNSTSLEQCLELLSDMLHWNPASRPSAKSCKQHPFLSSFTSLSNQSEDDILVRDVLEARQKEHPGRFKIWYTVDRPKESWKYSSGFVTDEMIKAHMPAPGPDTVILMCGPPPMIKFACKQNLDKLGYDKSDQIEF